MTKARQSGLIIDEKMQGMCEHLKPSVAAMLMPSSTICTFQDHMWRDSISVEMGS